MKRLLTLFTSLILIFGFIAAIALPIYLIIVTMILDKTLPNWFVIVNLILSFLEVMFFISLLLLQNDNKANSIFGRKTN